MESSIIVTPDAAIAPPRRTLDLPTRCALSLLYVAAAFAVRWLIDPLLGASIPLFTFTLATILAALTLGLVPGLLAMVVGFFAGAYVFARGADLTWTVIGFGVVGVVSAILGHLVRSQRLRLEKAAADAQRQARALVLAEETTAYALLESQTATWDLNLDTGEIFWSANAARLFGLRDGENGPRFDEFDRFIHPDDRAVVHETIDRAIAERRSYEASHRIVLPDGTVRSLLAKGRARYERGRAVRMSGIVLDVTHLRAAEAAQRESEERLMIACDAAALGTWDFNLTSGEVLWSPRCRELFGVGPTEPLTFDRFLKMVFADDQPVVDAATKAAIDGANDGALYIDYRIVVDGAVRWIRAKGRAYFDHGGRATRLIGIAADVTGEKSLNDSLRRAKEASDVANEAKSAFLANMSHEIRTPLNAIMGFSELLLDPALSSPERHDCVATISRNGQMLARLIDDILDLSKVEAGKLALVKESVEIAGLLAEVGQVMQDMARRNGVVLEMKADPSLPGSMQTDPIRLRQVLINIVGNAVKFTHNGRVDVRARILSRHEGDVCTLGFIVTDEGPGIDPTVHDRLFQPFQQSDASTTRKFGGTGLGLALSRRLARALGGDVELVRSVPGQGSVFLISLQAAVDPTPSRQGAAAKPVIAASPVALDGLKVLVVEDTPDSQFLIRRILQKAGAIVEAANDGAEAITMALATAYDVVLMDIQMPEIDGYEATATLRERGFDRPIIALTAHAMKEERERTRALGFDDHVTKPINPASLVRTVSKHADLRRAAPPA